MKLEDYSVVAESAENPEVGRLEKVEVKMKKYAYMPHVSGFHRTKYSNPESEEKTGEKRLGNTEVKR